MQSIYLNDCFLAYYYAVFVFVRRLLWSGKSVTLVDLDRLCCSGRSHLDFNAKHHVQTFCLPCFVPKLISSSLLAEQIEAGSNMVGSENYGENVWTKPEGFVEAEEECSCSERMFRGWLGKPGQAWPLSLFFKIVSSCRVFQFALLISHSRFECLLVFANLFLHL